MKKVIIIGAGIIGATCAYQLSKKDIAVTVVDAQIRGRATSAGAGIICPWVAKRKNKAWYKLAKNGAAYYSTLINELKEDGFHQTGYKKVGAIRLHEDVTKLEEVRDIAIARKKDAPEIGGIHIIPKEEVHERAPFIKDSYAGLLIEGAARVDGHLLRNAMLDAAVLNGVELIEAKATLAKNENGQANVIVNDTVLEADQIIATNGVWMNELLAPLEIDLNISAQKGEIIHLQVDDIDTSSLPIIMPPNNQYMLSFDNGKMVVGASNQQVKQLDTKITAKGTHHILEQALKVAPVLSDSSIVETRVGFRPFTFNHLPIFGPLPTQQHILVANGLGASGLTTGPYIGKQLAMIVADEETDIPIDDYCVEQVMK